MGLQWESVVRGFEESREFHGLGEEAARQTWQEMVREKLVVMGSPKVPERGLDGGL